MSNRLKQTRLKYGKKQAEVAAVIGVGVPAYSMMESGKREIGSSKIIKLAKYYGCSTDELLGSWLYYEENPSSKGEQP